MKFVVPFFLQIWFFATPIAYPASLAPKERDWVFWLNPLSGLVEGIRAALFSTRSMPYSMILASLVTTFLTFLVAVIYFRRIERSFADVI